MSVSVKANAAGTEGEVLLNGSVVMTFNQNRLALSGNALAGAPQSAEYHALTRKDYVDSSRIGGFKNKLINGAMIVTQRGPVTPAPGVPMYTLDRWMAYCEGVSPQIARGAGDQSVGGEFAYAMSITGVAGNINTVLNQRIESGNAYPLAGKTATFSARIYNNGPAFTPLYRVLYPNAIDDYTATTEVISGAFQSCGAGWTTVSFTVYIPAGCANGIMIEINMLPTGAGVIKGLTGTQFELGPFVTPFEHRSVGEELLLCQRYYEQSDSIGLQLYGEAGASMQTPIHYLVQKRVIPTVVGTITGSGNVSANDFSLYSNRKTFTLGLTCVATGILWATFTFKASAEL